MATVMINLRISQDKVQLAKTLGVDVTEIIED